MKLLSVLALIPAVTAFMPAAREYYATQWLDRCVCGVWKGKRFRSGWEDMAAFYDRAEPSHPKLPFDHTCGACDVQSWEGAFLWLWL